MLVSTCLLLFSLSISLVSFSGSPVSEEIYFDGICFPTRFLIVYENVSSKSVKVMTLTIIMSLNLWNNAPCKIFLE